MTTTVRGKRKRRKQKCSVVDMAKIPKSWRSTKNIPEHTDSTAAPSISHLRLPLCTLTVWFDKRTGIWPVSNVFLVISRRFWFASPSLELIRPEEKSVNERLGGCRACVRTCVCIVCELPLLYNTFITHVNGICGLRFWALFVCLFSTWYLKNWCSWNRQTLHRNVSRCVLEIYLFWGLRRRAKVKVTRYRNIAGVGLCTLWVLASPRFQFLIDWPYLLQLADCPK